MNKKIYASDYARLDSDVYTGGGTDDTEVLQKLLDKATEWGHLHLVMDGAALIRGLKLHSNTTIECMDKSCGFYLADDSNCALIINADADYNHIRTHNISLIGGTYNQNCLHQEHHTILDHEDGLMFRPEAGGGQVEKWTIALEFYGIEYLNIRDVTVRNQRTFAVTIGNFKYVNVENTYIDLPDLMDYGNQDGFHFWGPGQFLTVRNVGGRTGDDFINIGPDECDSVSSITDVLIDGVMLDDAWQGIRMLSRDKGRLDRVTVRNVTGTYRSYGFYINPWFPGKFGNFGSIFFENIDLQPIQRNCYEPDPFLFLIGADIERITLKNIHWNAYDNREIIYLGKAYYDDAHFDYTNYKPRIREFTLDGLQISDNREENTAEYIKVDCKIDSFILRDTDVNTTGGKLIVTKPYAEVKNMLIDRTYVQGVEKIAEIKDGKVENLLVNNLITVNEHNYFDCNDKSVSRMLMKNTVSL